MIDDIGTTMLLIALCVTFTLSVLVVGVSYLIDQ